METFDVFTSQKESPEVSREVIERGLEYLSHQLGVTKAFARMVVEGNCKIQFNGKGFAKPRAA